MARRRHVRECGALKLTAMKNGFGGDPGPLRRCIASTARPLADDVPSGSLGPGS